MIADCNDLQPAHTELQCKVSMGKDSAYVCKGQALKQFKAQDHQSDIHGMGHEALSERHSKILPHILLLEMHSVAGKRCENMTYFGMKVFLQLQKEFLDLRGGFRI